MDKRLSEKYDEVAKRKCYKDSGYTHTYLVTVETGLVVRRHADQVQSYCGPQEGSRP